MVWSIAHFVLWGFLLADPGEDRLRILFLGDTGHHHPDKRAEQLIPVLHKRNIDVTYTSDLQSLRHESLRAFDGLIIYANIEKLPKELEASLIRYVEDGHALIAIHCASYCFLDSPRYVELVGAQFLKHEAEIVRTQIFQREHPVMKGFDGFESWDETYVHHRHNDRDRVVLEYRVGGIQAEGHTREPWTWVRTQGKGRVFYTAWGHDERTWSHAGFHNLIERGIRWACERSLSVMPAYADPNRFTPPIMTTLPKDVKPFEYVEVGAKIPNYPAGKKWGEQDEPFTKMQKPLSPEESAKHWVTPEGFEMRLFASEPKLSGKPIAMNWDERGRLLLCETIDYPNELQPPGKGRDRIRICEDTNSDGIADRFTVFAEGLSMPTAIMAFRGGYIVQDGAETVFLKDNDGDGKADERSVLITGWALGDTHGGVSNFRYGHDNWIWGMQGYNPSQPTANGKKFQAFRMGFFRFKLDSSRPPRVTDIEFIRSTNNNTWGLGFSEEGLIFGSTANGNPSVYVTMPNRYLERVRGWTPTLLSDAIADSAAFKPITDKVRQVDNHGNYSAAAGHALYTARVYPPTWWNKTAFVCGPEGHLVGTFVLRPNGTTFRSTSPCNLVASDDEWSAPIAAEVGPDGNVWIADWYNYIVQHNPTPLGFETGKGNAYETDLRDKKHARIYRLVYSSNTDDPLHAPPRFDSPGEMVKALSHPTMFWRLEAQRLLVDRNKKDVMPALLDLVRDRSVDELQLNPGALHALWTLHGLKAIDGFATDVNQVVEDAMAHPSASVRRAALLVVPRSESPRVREGLRSALEDSSAQVRLAGLLALSEFPPSPDLADILADRTGSLLTGGDQGLRDALTVASAMHGEPFLHALFHAKQILSPGSADIVRVVAEHMARGKADGATMDRILSDAREAPSELASALIEGLVRGWPKDHSLPASAKAEDALVSLLVRLTPTARALSLQLGDHLSSKRLREEAKSLISTLEKEIADSARPDGERIEAARNLIAISRSRRQSVPAILDQVVPQASPELCQGLLETLKESHSLDVGPQIIARISGWTPAARRMGISLMLSRPTNAQALLGGVESGKIALDELSLDQRQALANHPDKKVADRSAKIMAAGGGLPDPDREKILQSLLPLTGRKGDVARGKEVFKKACAKCHRHGGEGEGIGPDLTGMAVHPKSEMLLNIIDPSRSVEANFRVTTIATVDGLVQTGLLTAESKTSIEIIDAEAKRHAIAREDVEEISMSRKSFMPEGFEKQLKEEEIVDLLEFLAARGKYTPLDLRSVASVVTTRGMFTSESADVERLVFEDWSPKSVDGIPFLLIDPRGNSVPNAIMLKGSLGEFPPRMPGQVKLAVGQAAKRIHVLGGVSGWGFPAHAGKSVTARMRLTFDDGTVEDHDLFNGIHFADYIRVVDVPGSKLAFRVRGQQVRYFTIDMKSDKKIESLELIKQDDPTSPIFLAITVESR